MEPEMHDSLDQSPPGNGPWAPETNQALESEEQQSPGLRPPGAGGIEWVFLGPQGLRAGWSVLIFVCTYLLASMAAGGLLARTHLVSPKGGMTPRNIFFNELTLLAVLVGVGAVMALIERRRVLDYNLTGPRPTRHFFSGLLVGFAGLSLLVGELSAGHWLHLRAPALSGAALLGYALIWGCVFLMVGCVEEGAFRCYLQYTLTRGINFWWALGAVTLMCADLLATHKGNGAWGDYAVALLGLIPCFLLHQKHALRSAFWQAAWVTSTLFGFVHTGNGGENWIGIFSAAAIGFIFCVSIRVTGSAWWAIGCHAGWDWAETYFYGTPDSGLTAPGHLLTSTAGRHAAVERWHRRARRQPADFRDSGAVASLAGGGLRAQS